MANPQYIEYLNTFGADIHVKPQSPKIVEPPEKQDTAKLKKHIAKGLPPTTIVGIDDLPFKVKTDEWEWQEVEGIGKFPKNYKPDVLDFD